jgi:hypothetical protein
MDDNKTHNIAFLVCAVLFCAMILKSCFDDSKVSDYYPQCEGYKGDAYAGCMGGSN